jgi:thiol-disulfide isomerase/thioredoxin
MREGHQVTPFVVAALLAVVTLARADQAEQASSMAAQRLVGRTAPRIEPGLIIGPRSPLNASESSALLVFFWAHWCPQCKAESPTIAALVAKYRSRGLALVAPTRRYGYVEGGRPAAPDKELRYIAQVRDTSYKFLQSVPVPIAESNHVAFGVDAVPTHVIIDRGGTIRFYNAGRLSEEELEDAIISVLQR